MYHIKNRRKSRASTAQLERLVKFMEENPAAVSGKLTATFTKADKDRMWAALVEELNEMGKEAKSLDKWKKTWIDFKSNCRERAKCVREQALDPPGERWQIRKMGELEGRVAALLGRTDDGRRRAEAGEDPGAATPGPAVQVPVDWSAVTSLPGLAVIRVAETTAQREEGALIIPGSVREVPMDDASGGGEMPVAVKMEVLSAPPSPEPGESEASETFHTAKTAKVIKKSPNAANNQTAGLAADLENKTERQNNHFQSRTSTSVPINQLPSLQANSSEVANQQKYLQSNRFQVNTEGGKNSATHEKVLYSRMHRKRMHNQEMVQVQRETNEILRNQTEAFKEMTNAFNRIADAIYSLSVNRN